MASARMETSIAAEVENNLFGSVLPRLLVRAHENVSGQLNSLFLDWVVCLSDGSPVMRQPVLGQKIGDRPRFTI